MTPPISPTLTSYSSELQQLHARIAQLEQNKVWAGMLNQIIQTIRDTLVLDKILQTTADHLHQALGVSRCLIFRPDLSTRMRARHVSEATLERDSLLGVQCDFYSYYHEQLASGETVILSQIHQNCSNQVRDSAKACQIQSLMIVPLLYRPPAGRSQAQESPSAEEKPVSQERYFQPIYMGGISLHQCDRHRDWTADEIAFVRAIADHCAIAIQHAQLYEDLQTQLHERHQAAASLRQSEAKFATAFRCSPNSMVIATLDEGRYIEVNDTFLQDTGYLRHEVIGKTSLELKIWEHPGDRARMVKQLLERGKFRDLEITYVDRQGHERVERRSGELIYIEGVPCILAVSEDITEKQRTQAALQASERLFRGVFEQTFQFMWLLDPDGTLVKANQTALNFYGLSADSVCGKLFWEPDWWSDPQLQTQVQMAISQARLGHTICYEAHILGAQGVKAHIDFSLKPITDETGEVVMLIAEGRDITTLKTIQQELKQTQDILRRTADALEVKVEERTHALKQTNLKLQTEIQERQRAEDALRISQARLRFLLSYSPGVIYSCKLNANFDVTFVSQNVTNLYGYQPEDFLNDNQFWIQRVHPDDIPSLTQALEDLSTFEQSCHEYRFRHQDGTYRWIYDQKRLVRDIQGNPLEIVGYSMEISSRKQAEEQLMASLKEKEVLLKEIHHRVKNNLQVISSLLKLQSDAIADPRVLVLFKDSYHRVRSMALIHEKLYGSEDLSRINAPDYIRSLTASLLSSYTTPFGRNPYNNSSQLDLQLKIDSHWLDVNTAIPCGLIINELVSNALKYAFPQGQAGTVEVKFGLKDSHFILIVSDNGIGLPTDFSLETIESLGLQLVVNLTEQLRGTLVIETTSGTHFKIIFPAHA